MQDWVQPLLDLQDVDIRMAKVTQELQALPGKQQSVERLYADEQQALEAAKAVQKEAELRNRKFENEIGVAEEKKRNFQSKTVLIKNNDEYKAALLQIEMCENLVRQLEDQQLQAMEDIENAKAEVAVKQKIMESARHRADLVKEELQELKNSCEEQLAEMKVQREQLASQVDARLLPQYERLRRGRNTVATAPCFVPVLEEACGRCRMRLTKQLCQDLLHGKQATCPLCGAMLYAE